jgi:hypothetical protein
MINKSVPCSIRMPTGEVCHANANSRSGPPVCPSHFWSAKKGKTLIDRDGRTWTVDQIRQARLESQIELTIPPDPIALKVAVAQDMQAERVRRAQVIAKQDDVREVARREARKLFNPEPISQPITNWTERESEMTYDPTHNDEPETDPDSNLPDTVRVKIKEAEAIATVVRELAELPSDGAMRVLRYVQAALGLVQTPQQEPAASGRTTPGPKPWAGFCGFIAEFGKVGATIEDIRARYNVTDEQLPALQKSIRLGARMGRIKIIGDKYYGV